MLLIDTLDTGDVKWPEKRNSWLKLLDMMQYLQDQVMEIGSRGEERCVGEAFSVKEGRVAEGFGNVAELDMVEVA